VANKLPHLDEGLCFRITPRKTALFQGIGAPAPLLAKLDGPLGDHTSISQWVKKRRTGDFGTVTGHFSRIRRRDRRWQPRWVCLALIPKQHREPSLDTPNTRPTTVSSQGPKLTHGKSPSFFTVTSFRKIRPLDH
jgi:hypothetical protein